jgi:drug/metabolite transporter (DMT)-like permease
MQMICGGLLQIATAGLLGEFGRFQPSAVSVSSMVAWVYLVFFGAILAYTAYNWLLRNRPPAQVATYAYVNPVVAVFLGVGFAGEKMTPMMLAGAALIVAAVAAVIAQQSSGTPARPVSPDAVVSAEAAAESGRSA